MQCSRYTPAVMALLLAACSSSAPVVRYDEASSTAELAPSFALFTRDAVLYEAAQRAQSRIEAALGHSRLALAEPQSATSCQPFQASCGFEVAFDEVVYCHGSSEPALACTAQGARGKALGIKLQASLSGEELDNRLIHELFHVITLNRARHSRDGLFMEYTFGHERITQGTLEAVCEHFSCSHMTEEEDAGGE